MTKDEIAFLERLLDATGEVLGEDVPEIDSVTLLKNSSVRLHQFSVYDVLTEIVRNFGAQPIMEAIAEIDKNEREKHSEGDRKSFW